MSTIRIYRIVHKEYADDPFSGEGGLYAASRWASRGQLVSYASESLALATLEKIAGAGRLGRLRQMVYVPAALRKKDIQVLKKNELPEEWDRRPPGTASRAIGDQWLQNAASVALSVPSVTLPEGSNYVLNPKHPAFAEAVSPKDPVPLELDPRVIDRLRNGDDE